MNKAIFLDRDGIINEDVRYPYLPEHIRFCESIFNFCGAALKKGYLLIVVTNQAGVAKGYFSEDDVKRLHEWMRKQFLLQGISITAFYYCPFHADGTIVPYNIPSDYRKPLPGMFLQAAADHSINLADSLMIGDKPSDRIFLPELRSIIIKSSYTPDAYDVRTLSEIIPQL